MTSHVRQTLKNVSDQPIEVELLSNLIFQSGIVVRGPNGIVSKRYVPPTPHDMTAPRIQSDFRRIDPAGELVIIYAINEFMTEMPTENVLYTISVRADLGYRYLNEARDAYAYIRRADEAHAKKQYPARPYFEGVRLK